MLKLKLDKVGSLCGVWATIERLVMAKVADTNGRICLRERLLQFDSLGHGFVTAHQFSALLLRQLKNLLPLTAGEVDQLADYFKVPDGRINYRQICDVIDDAVQKLQDKETAEETQLVVNSLSEIEERELFSTVEEIANKLQLMTVVPALNMGNRMRDTLNHAQFGRLLAFLGVSLSPREFSLLVRKFAVDPGTVSYAGFLAYIRALADQLQARTKSTVTITPFMPHKEEPNLPTSAHCRTNQLGDLEDVLDRIRRRLVGRRFDLRPLLLNCDRQNNGYISERPFLTVMHDAGFMLTKKEVSTLTGHYREELGLDYLRLLKDLNLDPPIYKEYEKLHRTENTPCCIPAPGPFLPNLLKHIGHLLVRGAIDVEGNLRQFDPRKRLVVSKGDFVRALDSSELELSPTDMETIAKGFGVNGGIDGPQVNYTRFLEAVRQQMCELGREDQGWAHLNFKERQLALDTLTVLGRHYHNLNLMEIFQDQDKLNTGGVSHHQLLQALARRKFGDLLSRRQLEVVAKAFRQPDGHVDYRALDKTLQILMQ